MQAEQSGSDDATPASVESATNSDVKVQPTAAPQPAPQPASQPASQPAADVPPLPEGLTDADVANPNDIRKITSFDALNDELSRLNKQIKDLENDPRGGAALARARRRRIGAQGQLTLVTTMVDNGKLDVAGYLVCLKNNIKTEIGLLKVVKARRGEEALEDIKAMVRRIKIMQKEAAGAEKMQAEQNGGTG